MNRPAIARNLITRIEGDIARFQGNLPERYAIAWRSYLCALLEWEVLHLRNFHYLAGLLPNVEDDPSVDIMLGREEPYDPDAKPIEDPIELLDFRIKNDLDYFKGKMPERNATAWHAYLYALLEWGWINQPTFDRLAQLLPPIADDPTLDIIRGDHRAQTPP